MRAILTAVVVAVALPVAAQVVDSPLVALAKRTGRLAKHPTHVITNDDLYATGGRVSWASETDADTTQAPAAAKADDKPAAPKAAPKIDFNAITARLMAATAPVQQAAPREGSTRASYSTPVSTAQNAPVASTAVTSSGQSTAQNANVSSTVRSTPMQQTAPATNLPPVQPGKVD